MSHAGQTAQPLRAPARNHRMPADLLGWTLLTLGIAVHLLFLLSLRWGWLNPLFNDGMHRFGPGCDFFSIYAAGLKARLGESVFTIGQHLDRVPYAYAFRYAPLVAYTLGAALSLLPPVTAYGLWLVLCELALLNNIRLTLLLATRHGDTETRSPHGEGSEKCGSVGVWECGSVGEVLPWSRCGCCFRPTTWRCTLGSLRS